MCVYIYVCVILFAMLRTRERYLKKWSFESVV